MSASDNGRDAGRKRAKCIDLHQLIGWLDDARSGRVQSVAVGFYMWRWRELWKWPCEVERFKGQITITVGPIFVEFGG